MKVTKYVSSNERWIKADVEIERGRLYKFIIDRVTEEELEHKGHMDLKPCLWFREIEKGFPLNKTNARMLTEIFGSDETDDWIGRKIEIYRAMTQFGNKQVPCIRIKPPDVPVSAVREALPSSVVMDELSDEDQIPF